MADLETFLTAEQQGNLTVFQEICQISDDELCIQILSEHSWNVDNAVNSFMSQNNASETAASSSNHMEPPSNIGSARNRNIATQNRAVAPEQQQRPAAPRQNNAILEVVLTPLRWLFQTHPISLNRELDTRKFIGEFDLKYDSTHPTFVDGSYQSAVARAFQQSKFLLIYLHSPMHEDTSKFCSQVMCSDSFSQFANQNVICWAGKIWDPEAYDLSSQLRASSYPFLALLVCQSDRVVQIADRVQGFLEGRLLEERLRNQMTTHSAVLTRTRTEASRRAESSQLREQQDREYREAAEADRRDRLRREEELNERVRAGEEEKERETLAQAMELSNKLSWESSLKRLRETLPSEPEPADDVAAVRFQLPQGVKLARRFHRNHSVQMIYDFLNIHFDEKGINVRNFMVSTSFPKADLTDMRATVSDLGLHPRGMLYVQDLDA